MATIKTLQYRLEVKQKALAAAYEAYQALLLGRVQSYTIGSRSLSRFDLPDLEETIANLEKEIDELENAIANGGRRRKAIGVVPRDF